MTCLRPVWLLLCLAVPLTACASGPDDGTEVHEGPGSGAPSYEDDARFVPDENPSKAPPVTAEPTVADLPIDQQNAELIAALGGTADATIAVSVQRHRDRPIEEQQSATSGRLRVLVSRPGLPTLDLSIGVAQWEPVLEVVDRLAAQVPAEWRTHVTRVNNTLTIRGVTATWGDPSHTGLELSWRFNSPR